jgi:monoamine oxidase
MSTHELNNKKVIVAGAGLAGLAAARDLELAGARVAVCEARERVGGRVLTIREGFAAGQHAEGGADLIEGAQRHLLDLATAVGLEPVRILRRGWGFYGADARGRRRVHAGARTWGQAAHQLRPEIQDYCLSEKRWDSAIAVDIARRSVSEWLRDVKASPIFVAGMRGLRGFFLADPEELSLIAVVDQFSADDDPGDNTFCRIPGGNDLLPQYVAKYLKGTVHLRTVVRRIVQDADGVRVTVERNGRRDEMPADFCVLALPASTLRDVIVDPQLPPDQQRAIASLRYGPATRVLLQFARRFWRRATRPIAFGSDLPIGAVWDGNEQQRGPAGILSLLAGGRASRELQDIVKAEGGEGVARRLAWMGTPSTLLSTRVITWEADEWARGGYAYFDPTFDPRLRAWLSRPAGRLLFAGEHTSERWQGYMTGAVESGKRAAAEVRHLARMAGA